MSMEESEEGGEEWDEESSSGSSDSDDPRCPICLQRLGGVIGVPGPCEHAFCIVCLLEWAKKVNTCPVDRLTFNEVSVRDFATGEETRREPVLPAQINEQPLELTFCEVCGSSNFEDRLLLCDGCDKGIHLECCTPPLTNVPMGDWFCPTCVPSVSPSSPTELYEPRVTRTVLSDRIIREIRRTRAAEIPSALSLIESSSFQPRAAPLSPRRRKTRKRRVGRKKKRGAKRKSRRVGTSRRQPSCQLSLMRSSSGIAPLSIRHSPPGVLFSPSRSPSPQQHEEEWSDGEGTRVSIVRRPRRLVKPIVTDVLGSILARQRVLHEDRDMRIERDGTLVPSPAFAPLLGTDGGAAVVPPTHPQSSPTPPRNGNSDVHNSSVTAPESSTSSAPTQTQQPPNEEFDIYSDLEEGGVRKKRRKNLRGGEKSPNEDSLNEMVIDEGTEDISIPLPPPPEEYDPSQPLNSSEEEAAENWNPPPDETRRPTIQFSIPTRHRLVPISSLLCRQRGVMKKEGKGAGRDVDADVKKAFGNTSPKPILQDSSHLLATLFGMDEEEQQNSLFAPTIADSSTVNNNTVPVVTPPQKIPTTTTTPPITTTTPIATAPIVGSTNNRPDESEESSSPIRVIGAVSSSSSHFEEGEIVEATRPLRRKGKRKKGKKRRRDKSSSNDDNTLWKKPSKASKDRNYRDGKPKGEDRYFREKPNRDNIEKSEDKKRKSESPKRKRKSHSTSPQRRRTCRSPSADRSRSSGQRGNKREKRSVSRKQKDRRRSNSSSPAGKRKREKNRKEGDLRDSLKEKKKKKKKRERSLSPAKAIFATGDSIVVSLSFAQKQKEPDPPPNDLQLTQEGEGERKKESERRKENRKVPKKTLLVDLASSPAQERSIGASPTLITLSDDEEDERLMAADSTEPQPPSPPRLPSPPRSDTGVSSSRDVEDGGGSPVSSPQPPLKPPPVPVLNSGGVLKDTSRGPQLISSNVLATISSALTYAPLFRPPIPKITQQKPRQHSNPIFKDGRGSSNGEGRLGRGGRSGDSPFSPNSTDGDDLFEPPREGGTGGDGKPASVMETLFGPPPTRPPRRSKKPGKRGAAKVKTEVRLSEGELRADDLPTSAVELRVKEKFLKKLNRQERVVEEVKLSLKPHYSKKAINKEEYKEILRRAVPKICHNKTGEINPCKIKELIEAYVKKFRRTRGKNPHP